VDTTHKGQLAGNWGRNMVLFVPSFEKHFCVAGFELPSPTPASPEAKMIDTPREPVHDRHTNKSLLLNCMMKYDSPSKPNSLQTRIA